MLTMSYNYVQAHEAEKTNFTSGITILRQKISNGFQSILGKSSSEDLQRQQEMLRNYKELSSYITHAHCTISISDNDIQERISTLASITPAQYKLQALSYSSFASKIYTEIQEKCKK